MLAVVAVEQGLQLAKTGALPGGYGPALLEAIIALAVVCGLAWMALRWVARRSGVGPRGAPGRIALLERMDLEPGRSLYLVRLADRVLLLGAGRDSSPTLLTELRPSELPPGRAHSSPSTFKRMLARSRVETQASGTDAVDEG